ncbi:exo-alpha-sialidase [Aciduliprofundum sp. MAR08-339]|uniref:exo-alpha-sialidase n=1 Tax=Aciduliprofundum sp. (strain MAR08-339) TaxID=673860 RepID=UPI001389C47A
MRNVIRKILERYGLDSKDIDALIAHFGRLEDIANSDHSKIASLTNLSKDDIVKLQDYLKNYLKSKKDNNNVGKDFLKRWGKVSSEEDLLSAYEEYNRLSRLYPKSPVVWEMRGEILEKMGRIEEAKKSYKKAYILHIKNGDTPPRELKEKIEKKTPAATPKIGLSNGFGNINGFKNGIINGTGIVNGTSTGWSGPKGTNPWKATVAILLVFLIIAAPLVGFIFFEKHNVYAVDGNFSEWSQGVAYHGLEQGNKSVNINYVKFHTAKNGIYFYVNLTGKNDFKSPHGIYIFFDTDNSTSTGYLVEGIGADYMVELYGWNNTLKGKELYKFNSSDQNNYGGFKAIQSVPAVLERNQIEGFGPIESKNFRAIVISYNYRNSQDVAPCPEYGKTALIIEEYAEQKVIPVNKPAEILQLKITGPKFIIHSISFRIKGTANISELGNFTLVMNGTPLSKIFSISGDVITFPNINKEIPANSKISLILTSSSKNMEKTVMFSIENIDVNIPYYIEKVIIGADYIGALPSTPQIDGSFLDWRDVKNDSPNDVISPNGTRVSDPNVDILRYGDYTSNSTPLLVYLQVQGKMLGGTDVPVVRAPLPPKNNNSVIINQTNLPHKKIYGMDTIDIFINSDNDKNTGFSPSNYKFGADYMVQIYGRDGVVYNASLYRYVDGNWSFVRHVKYALGYHSIELNSFLHFTSGDVLIVTFNWKEYMDVSDSPLVNEGSTENILSIHLSNNTPVQHSKPYEKIEHFKFKVKDGSIKYEKIKLTLTQGFGQDIPVTSSNYTEYMPDITRTSDGTIWVVYNNNSNYLSLAISTDGGKTWGITHPFNVNNAINATIIADSSDNVYIFYENHSSSSNFSYIKISPTGDETLYIYNSTNWWKYVYHPSVAIYNDYIYLFFDYHPNNYYYIGYINSADLGGTWNGYLIYNVTTYPGLPQVTITTGSLPKVFVAFQDYYSYTYSFITLIYNNTEIGSNQWNISEVIYAYTSSGFGYRGALIPSIYSSGDYIYVAVDSQYGYMLSLFNLRWIPIDWDIFVAYSSNNGASWNVTQVKSTLSTNEEYPWVVASRQTVYVFYLNATTGYICMVESDDGGNTWSNAYLVSDQGSGVGIYRTVNAILSGGRLYVVWTDNRNGQDDIYFDTEVPEFNNAIIPLIMIVSIAIILRRRNTKMGTKSEQ